MIANLFGTEYLVLDDWLAVATKGLSDESAARVTEEIQEHYEESVATLVAEGYRPGGAELETLSRLGSPRRARRGYRREYTTERDVKTFQRYQEELNKMSELGSRLHWREMYVVGTFLLVLFASFMEDKKPEVPLAFPVCMFSVVIGTTAGRIALRLSRRQGRARRFGMYLAVQFLLIWIMAAYIAAISFYTGFLGPFLIFLLFLLFLTIHQYRFWKKIRPILNK